MSKSIILVVLVFSNSEKSGPTKKVFNNLLMGELKKIKTEKLKISMREFNKRILILCISLSINRCLKLSNLMFYGYVFNYFHFPTTATTLTATFNPYNPEGLLNKIAGIRSASFTSTTPDTSFNRLATSE